MWFYFTRTLYLQRRGCDLHHRYSLFARQGVWFASHVHFICTTGHVVCIIRTLYLYDRECGLHHTYTWFARQGVWFASHVHFICTTVRVVCITRTLYLHDNACGLHHTYTLFARQGVIRVGGMDVVWRISDDWGRIKFFEWVLLITQCYSLLLRCLEFFMSIF